MDMVDGMGDALSSVVDFVRFWLFLAFLCVLFMFVIHRVRAWVSHKTGFRWFFSTLLSTFGVVFVLALLAYLVPWQLASSDVAQSGQFVPEALQFTPAETVGVLWISFLRVLVFSIVVTFLVLPLEFIASYVFRRLSQNQKPVRVWPLTALAVSLVVLLFFMLFTFVPFGLAYMLYWGIS